MKRSPFWVGLATLLSVVLFGACSPTWEARSIRDKGQQSAIAVNGWVPVEFSLGPDDISVHRGRLDKLYDEFVGGLLDDGLALDNTGWLKPTYGNQNLLWTLDSAIGIRRQQALLKSREAFQSNTYVYRNGFVAIGNQDWKYVGYTDKTLDTAVFHSFVFVWKGSASGISVFCWGEDFAIPPQRNPSIRKLLSKLSSNCK